MTDTRQGPHGGETRRSATLVGRHTSVIGHRRAMAPLWIRPLSFSREFSTRFRSSHNLSSGVSVTELGYCGSASSLGPTPPLTGTSLLAPFAPYRTIGHVLQGHRPPGLPTEMLRPHPRSTSRRTSAKLLDAARANGVDVRIEKFLNQTALEVSHTFGFALGLGKWKASEQTFKLGAGPALDRGFLAARGETPHGTAGPGSHEEGQRHSWMHRLRSLVVCQRSSGPFDMLQIGVRGDVLRENLDGDGAVETGCLWLCRPRPCRLPRGGRRFRTGRAAYRRQAASCTLRWSTRSRA